MDRHKTELRFGSHRNKALQNDWNAYGEDKFVFKVLSELERSEDEHLNYNQELKTLQSLIVEEHGIENTY